MPQRLAIVFCTLCAALVLTGCGGPSLTRLTQADERLPPAVELSETPFHAQTEYQCGPAALATVLGASGIGVAPDDLVGAVYVPQLKGSLQAEMIAATRPYDRLAYRIAPDLDTLLATLAEGYPVLVLQNLGVDSVPFWHYAVAIGYDAARNELLLRSGTQRRASLSARRFEGSWGRAQHWGIVVVQPGVVPRSATSAAFLEAAAGLESAGRLDAALAAYEASATRWPGEPVALLGQGNVHYRKGRLDAAQSAFRAAVALQPQDAVARNNLAQVLLELGRTEEALVEIEQARKVLTDPRFADSLAATESAIRAALSAPASRP